MVVLLHSVILSSVNSERSVPSIMLTSKLRYEDLQVYKFNFFSESHPCHPRRKSLSDNRYQVFARNCCGYEQL